MTPDDRRKPAAVAHLEDEAYTVLTAAADTTGNAMTTICRYVFADPYVYDKLHAELKTAFPDDTETMRFQVLEKLPYLVRKTAQASVSPHLDDPLTIIDWCHQ